MKMTFTEAKIFCKELGTFSNEDATYWLCEQLKTLNENLAFHVLPEEMITKDDGTRFFTYRIHVQVVRRWLEPDYKEEA